VTSRSLAEGKAPFGAFPSGTLGTILLKLLVLGLIDVLGIWAVAKAYAAGWWVAVAFIAVVLIALNVVYFQKGALPWKYLLPGLVFLIAFQLYPAGYTFGISFTNYGTGHIIDQERATTAIVSQNTRPVEGSPSIDIRPLESGGEISMLITDPETREASIGTGTSREPAPDATFDGDVAVAVPGYNTLNLGQLAGNADYDQQWRELAVPYDPEQGFYIQQSSPTRGSIVFSDLAFDPETGAFTNVQTGAVFTPNGDVGLFTTDAFDPDAKSGNPPSAEKAAANNGQFLTPGWPVFVGLDNYTQVLTDPGVRQNFVPILIWSFVFSIGTVLMQFATGLLMAIVFQERRMRGQKIYRSILIIPYALPIFMTALVWKGMLNRDFGIINQIIGQPVWWLGDPTLAKISLLVVNLWIGYSYFFIVVTGALTAIPGDLKEAAFVDGASGFTAFRTVVLPLLMVAVSPLLIASFSFNFNNYTLVDLLTGGGPFPGSPINGGQTDLLITYTYRLAFGTSEQFLAFAAAISMLIFLIVAGVSAYGFRLTKKLEEIKA
jgi:arabinogalactan oligomer/maltooligosaccharide transport system permease protein